MSEVKAHLIFIYKLTCLFNMGTQNTAKRSLKQMSRSMIAHNGTTSVVINIGDNGITDGYYIHCNAGMKEDTVLILRCIKHLKDLFLTLLNKASIADLTARKRIKRSFIKNYRSLFACAESVNKLAVRINDCKHLCITDSLSIADKFSLLNLKFYAFSLPSVCACILTCSTGSCLLVSQKLVKPILVNGHSLFFKNVLC